MHPLPISILLSLILLLFSCGDASKTGLSKAEEKLFVDTYVKLVLVASDHQVDADSLLVLRQSVFAEMGISEERFIELGHQGETHPERWADIWEQIVKRLEASSEGGQSK